MDSRRRAPLWRRCQWRLIGWLWQPRVRALISLTVFAALVAVIVLLGWALLSLVIIVGTTPA